MTKQIEVFVFSFCIIVVCLLMEYGNLSLETILKPLYKLLLNIATELYRGIKKTTILPNVTSVTVGQAIGFCDLPVISGPLSLQLYFQEAVPSCQYIHISGPC